MRADPEPGDLDGAIVQSRGASGHSSAPVEDSVWDFSEDEDSECDEDPVDGDFKYQQILKNLLLMHLTNAIGNNQ